MGAHPKLHAVLHSPLNKMLRSPPVSIIIPLYNKAHTLARALRSVLRQTYQDFEIVVVDDGSTDDSVSVLRGFSDARIRLLQQSNAGPGAARNRGVRESCGRFVGFLDADDELCPDFLERSLGNLKAHPQCAVSVCKAFSEPQKSVSHAGPMSPPEKGEWRLPVSMAPKSLNATIRSVHVTALWRKEPFLELGGFYENHCTLGEDTYLWLLVSLNCAIYFDAQPLFYYHTESSALNWWRRLNPVERNSASAIRQRPLPPYLTDPVRLRHNCPEHYRPLLEGFLALEALSEALTRVSVGDAITARWLRDQFPLMRSLRADYTKLRLKLLVPWAAPCVRKLRTRLTARQRADRPM